MEVRVGCCGWTSLSASDVGEETWREHYAHKLQLYAAHFPLVEVNSTFYRLPKVATAERWRELADEVNPDFEFTVKAFQGITHKARFKGPAAREAFARSAEIARALRANILLLQCPPSWGPTPENEGAFRSFLSEIERDEFLVVWEPRGRWEEEQERVAEFCEEFGLLHCTDPFKAQPVTVGPIAYLRLHGAPPGTQMYRYTYTDRDLCELRERILGSRASAVYVLFNNDTMVPDALRFRKLLGER